VAATSSCTAAYSVTTDWGSGFTGSLTITDSGTAAITGWTVNAGFACSSGPGLITDYTGTPTAYGAACKAILQALPAG
jgi:hypothetical protein